MDLCSYQCWLPKHSYDYLNSMPSCKLACWRVGPLGKLILRMIIIDSLRVSAKLSGIASKDIEMM